MSRLCIIYNTAPLYRQGIFLALDKEFDCDWYFGPTKSDIKEMDTSILKNVKYYKTHGNPNKLYFKRGVLKLLFDKRYNNYLILAEVRSITDWMFFVLANYLFPKKNVYIWTHGWYGREHGFDAKMKLWLYKHVKGTFVYGDRAKELLMQQEIPDNKLFVIHNSLDYESQIKIRAEIRPSRIYQGHFKNNYHTLLFIGRLTKAKKLDLLIEAVSILKEKGRLFNLVFVGNGDDAQNLKNKAEHLNLQSQVWFYGASYDEKVNAELIYNADLCVSPGNVGLTSIHSMMFGCPVISHRIFERQGPEFEAIKEGQTGAFFNYGSVDDLAKTIYDWFNQKDYSRDQIRARCYHEIDNYWTPEYQMKIFKENLKLC